MYDSNKSYNPGILIGSQKLITTILNFLLQALMGLHEEFWMRWLFTPPVLNLQLTWEHAFKDSFKVFH